jgi:hypothetical protein
VFDLSLESGAGKKAEQAEEDSMSSNKENQKEGQKGNQEQQKKGNQGGSSGNR